ncbi:RNA dependent RNA polymerase-domain-containing protein [Lentinula raphanica]|uniref:RNA-dependent RNA polymerase n=1 Tax=Lentinula raphanica TaxID=153919 RepID=A0AA38UJB3_9AGAR|nr:RNA dependent RNA polymerase-domain-containing protein [Lentinula raphanica]
MSDDGGSEKYLWDELYPQDEDVNVYNIPDGDVSLAGYTGEEETGDDVASIHGDIDNDVSHLGSTSLSEHPSFSSSYTDPALEEVMANFKFPPSTAPATEDSSNSASSSLTLVSDPAASDSSSEAAKNGTLTTTNFLRSITERRSRSENSASTSSSTVLGKRPASEAFVSDHQRASKLPRQGTSSPSLDDPIEVAYSKPHQKWITDRSLPWGVEWEIARLVSTGKVLYENITLSDLDLLKKEGTNANAAPRVERLLLRKIHESKSRNTENDHLFANERRSKFPFDELDREESLSADPYAGLGLGEHSDWFGGKVVFRAKLVDSSKKAKDKFRVELERAELGASSRFSRRFGSKSFVRLKISKTLIRHADELMNYLRRPFIIAGRVYRAFLEKEKNVFLYMTNESPDVGCPVDPMSRNLSFEAFLNWHNPIELNKRQSVAKYASRFALGLSTSAPGLEIEQQNIIHIADVVSPDGSDMTDGAGLINQAALQKLNHRFQWDIWPTAIQCRIAGAKGMLLLHPSDNSPDPRVFIRPSMNKIKYHPDQDLDHAQRVLDILRSCHPRFRCKLSSETIINLEENGVPKQVFAKLLDQTLDTLIASLTTWTTDEDMAELWSTLSHLGGVSAARSARKRTGLARVHGYSERDAQENDDEDGLDEADDEPGSTAWWNDEVSGQPSSLEETVMRFIDGGFKPESCPVMRDKLKRILIVQIGNHVDKFRIEVPLSFTAFILPDPENVLEEGEVYFKSSRRDILLEDGRYTDVLTGPVVVTRHPCKLPTDAQKWRAVDDRPELRQYTDVLILSVKGRRRAADWLGGGDYDGDKALCIYQPEIVNSFENADPQYGDPREDIKTQCFSEHTETVAELLARTPDPSEVPMARLHALQEYLLGGIKVASLVGQASNMHDYLIYMHGLKHPETIRLAHIFCHTLDGLKTGLKIRPEIWRRDTSRYDNGPMTWKESDTKGKRKNTLSTARMDNKLIERPAHLKPFIMDRLRKHAKGKGDKERVNLDEKYDLFNVALDEELAAPWKEQLALAERFKKETGCDRMLNDLEQIKKHVHKMWDIHRKELTLGPQKANTFTELAIETRQDILRRVSQRFASEPDEKTLLMPHDQILRVKASYAYLHDFTQSHKKWTRFPWDVSMRELTAIKAKATGRSQTVTADFYERMTLKRSRWGH